MQQYYSNLPPCVTEGPGALSVGNAVSRETPLLVPEVADVRLRQFATLLLRWNTTINLVSPTTDKLFWQRHIVDSLQLEPLIPVQARSVGDLGSGGGLPGIVLAIARAQTEFHLIESDYRKAAFLGEAVRVLELTNVVVRRSRLEQLDTALFCAVTARALAPMNVLLGWAHTTLKEGGCGLFLKGREGPSELAKARLTWQFETERFESRTSSEGHLYRVTGISNRAAQP